MSTKESGYTNISISSTENKVQSLLCFSLDDLISYFITTTEFERLEWEEAQLVPTFNKEILITTLATYRLKLAFLEAKFNYLQRRSRRYRELYISSFSRNSHLVKEEKQVVIHKQIESVVERLIKVAIPRWIEEDLHTEINVFCSEILSETGGLMLQNIIDEILSEHNPSR